MICVISFWKSLRSQWLRPMNQLLRSEMIFNPFQRATMLSPTPQPRNHPPLCLYLYLFCYLSSKHELCCFKYSDHTRSLDPGSHNPSWGLILGSCFMLLLGLCYWLLCPTLSHFSEDCSPLKTYIRVGTCCPRLKPLEYPSNSTIYFVIVWSSAALRMCFPRCLPKADICDRLRCFSWPVCVCTRRLAAKSQSRQTPLPAFAFFPTLPQVSQIVAPLDISLSCCSQYSQYTHLYNPTAR